MIRRVFAAASVLSLLLCFAATVVLLRSYWTTYDLTYCGPFRAMRFSGCRVVVERGLVFAESFRVVVKSGEEAEYDRRTVGSDSTWHRGWTWDASDSVAYSGPRALITGMWKFETASYDRLPHNAADPDDPVISAHFRYVWFPLWTLIVIFAILPSARTVLRWLARKVLSPVNCRICGYDLRASNDRCPECGTPIPARSEAA